MGTICKNTFKVIFVVPNLYAGGAERVVTILAKEFIDMGISVDIVLLIDSKIEYAIVGNINIVKLNTKNMSKIERVLCLRRYLQEEKKQYNNIIILPFLYSCLKNVLSAAVGLKIPVIASERNNPYKRSKIANMVYLFASACVFQTHDAKSYFNNLIQKKSKIIPNPLSNEISEEWKGCQSKYIISVGRLEEQKNHRLLIEAFEVVSKKHLDYFLYIYGEGSLKDSLHDFVIEKGIGDKVKFMGTTTDIHKKMSDAYMFVLSSDYEGMSNALLEAMAIGVPVISTDHPIGGAKEIIVHSENGLLIPVNGKKEMINAMNMLIEEPVFATQLGNQGKKVKEKLTSSNIARQWVELIYDTLGK